MYDYDYCTEKKERSRNLHGKNDFVAISKNLARYKLENNFVESSK